MHWMHSRAEMPSVHEKAQALIPGPGTAAGQMLIPLVAQIGGIAVVSVGNDDPTGQEVCRDLAQGVRVGHRPYTVVFFIRAVRYHGVDQKLRLSGGQTTGWRPAAFIDKKIGSRLWRSPPSEPGGRRPARPWCPCGRTISRCVGERPRQQARWDAPAGDLLVEIQRWCRILA